MKPLSEPEKKALYANVREVAGEPLALLEKLTAQNIPGTASVEERTSFFLQIEEAGRQCRQQATAYLTSDAVSKFDADLVYDIKRHVHTEIGSVLTKTRLLLESETAAAGSETVTDQDRLLAAWREAISSLHSGVWKKETSDIRGQILEAAKAAGISVTFSGDLPEEEDALRIFVKEASAKIVAAARNGEDRVVIS